MLSSGDNKLPLELSKELPKLNQSTPKKSDAKFPLLGSSLSILEELTSVVQNKLNATSSIGSSNKV